MRVENSGRKLMLAFPVLIILCLMLWFGKKQNKIRVEFLENGKDKPFAVSMIPIEQLPETFEISTTLDVSGKKWNIESATPKLRTDIERGGKLLLVLSPVQMVNPNDILFSLPTINDGMCGLQKASSLDEMLVIHEDDWRQIEFISGKLLEDIESEMKGIRIIHETKRKGPGFTGLHARKLIEKPLGGITISYFALKSLFTVSKEFRGFGFGSPMVIAERGFAFETKDGLKFYGVLNQEGVVIFLCLANTDGFADQCGKLMKMFHLVGVNWCRCQIIGN